MKNELISMVERIDQMQSEDDCDIYWRLSKIVEYKDFVKLDLNISFFVPAIEVNGKWEVLEKPKFDDRRDWDEADRQEEEKEQYKKAKDNVLFEGFDYSTSRDEYDFDMTISNEVSIVWDKNDIIYPNRSLKTIQDLVEYNVELTEQGLIKSGLK